MSMINYSRAIFCSTILLSAPAWALENNGPTACPAGVIVRTQDGPKCAYVVSVQLMQATFNSLDLFNLPTAALVKGFEIIYPVVGQLYRDEAKGGWRTLPTLPLNYVHLKNFRYITSGGPTQESWTMLPDGAVRYAFSIRLGRDLFNGNVRSWYKGAIARIGRRPEHAVQPGEMEAIEAALRKLALDALEAEAREIAARKAQRQPGGEGPHFPRFRPYV